MSVVIEALRKVDWTEKHILVACSGGVDSMVLLQGLLEIGLKPDVLHVNYGLRGADSVADEELVVDIASANGLNAQVFHCPVELTKQSGVNLQAAARVFRRKHFQQWIAQSPNHIVVLAHHANDQVETFFLQLYRGSGTFGLGGMHPDRGQLIRPFLEIEKTDLIAYAIENKVLWREDKSNATSNYLRNLFRNELLPALAQNQPELNQNVLFFMRLLREHQVEVNEQIREMSACWKEQGELNCADWLSLSEEEQVAFLHAIAFPVGLKQSMVGFPWDFKIEKIEILPLTFDKWTIYLDADQLSGELYLRIPQSDDRIDSIGMRGSQLVKAVLKDFGIPLNKRASFPVLTDGKTVLWLPGVKVGRLALANAHSKTILQVSMVPFV
ncbi:MAG: tRNA lysidine(34) synthetase TilS [Flavobacteriia bacterium]|nr:tRNA lysidine(34) synthetase TilS [Flavobacteriia bacterium]